MLDRGARLLLLAALRRRAEDHHQPVADEVVERAAVLDGDGGHLAQVLVQHERELLGLEALRQVGEADHVREEER